jgi:polyisoprenoid-binding protein YceI
MSIRPGKHVLGPENGALTVRTSRTGAAAKAGHDLVIDVTAWQAAIDVGDDSAQNTVALDADSTSLRVREGAGGIQALGDDDKKNIRQTIDDEILHGRPIQFRSTAVQPRTGGISVTGDLTLVGTTAPIAVDVAVGDDGTLRCTTVVKQTDWKIPLYSTLFGALKVADDVEVVIEARLPAN